MYYTDAFFLFQFAAIWLLTRLLNPWPKLREWVIILFSLWVIASWGLYDLALFLGVLALNFVAVEWIGRTAPASRKPILIGTIAADLLVLAIFKYANFFSGAASAALGLQLSKFPLGIPLAISFYTFHLISYVIDVSREKVRRLNVREYLFYLSFFPHVVAGPIVRAWQMVPQLGKVRKVPTDILMGLHYVALGVFLKSVLSNNVAQAIDPYWTQAASQGLSPLEHLVVAFLYYCQIYGDFAGYSLMALGMARLLGYRLPGNFRGPMVASSLQEFWRRWHITLSRWLRDYLYIPLGGSRVPLERIYVNLLVTMILGGLWHGAGWGFMIWGFMHGLGLMVHRDVRAARPKGATEALLFDGAGWLLTQLWVTATWVFFRSPDLDTALGFFRDSLSHLSAPSQPIRSDLIRVWLFALPLVLHNLTPLWIGKIPRKALGILIGVSTAFFLLMDLMQYSPAKVFIYFRF